jgi:hypothetical protein
VIDKIKKLYIKLSAGKRMILLILLTIVTCFLINAILFIPMPSLADNNAWLQFYGSVIGAVIGGTVTLWGIEYTIKSTIMNVKPVIRPVKTYFYVYSDKNSNGMTITEKKLNEAIKEYFEKQEIDLEELNIFMVIEAYSIVKEKHIGTKWDIELSKLDVNILYKDIRDILKYKTARAGFKLLFEELVEKYKDACNKSLIEDIVYELRELYKKRCENNIIFQEEQGGYLFIPVYNVGAGNALDIEVNWDVSNLEYRNVCDDLGFNDKDYLEMERSFSFKNMALLRKEMLMCEKDNNKVHIQISTEIIQLIKFIIEKSRKNNNEKKHANNNILVGENKIAQLNIKYYDIHGYSIENKYDIYLKIWDNIVDEYYSYSEKTFYFRFIDTEKG